MRDTANGGAHALHWAAAVLAGINSNGIVSGINYHSLTGSPNGGQQGFGIMGFGGSEDEVWVSGVAQVMAHLSALGTADPATTMHSVDAAAGGPTLGDLLVDGVGNLTALQAAAFFTPAAGGGAAGKLAVVILNRAAYSVPATIDLSALLTGRYAGWRDTTGRVPAKLTAYSALDRGGWQRMALSEVATTLPLPGPIKSGVRNATLSFSAGRVLEGIVAPPLSLQFVEVAMSAGHVIQTDASSRPMKNDELGNTAMPKQIGTEPAAGTDPVRE